MESAYEITGGRKAEEYRSLQLVCDFLAGIILCLIPLKPYPICHSGVAHLEEMVAESLELPVVNQVELHPFCQQRSIVEWCRSHNVIVQAYCPLMRGERWDHPLLKVLAEKYGKDVPQILIRWSLQMG